MPQLLDFRSDTVTRPSEAMRRVMAQAEVGDDVYGEDPTVRRLEELTAARLGLERGLFVTSGTQGNEIAIGVHCRPGDELIADEGSHCIQYEGGAMSALWGVQHKGLVTPRGLFGPKEVQAAVKPRNDHFPRSRLLVLENTHNRGGGSVWPLELFQSTVQAGRELGLAIHLDGARLFNAEVASGAPAAEYARLTDTTTVCFSKGLGAPVGSVLCASAPLIDEARRLRKRLGGGMRQVGILAAACLYALEHNVGRLAEDHRNAHRLAHGLASLRGVEVDLSRAETNLVYAAFPGPAPEWVARLKAHGILVNAEGTHPRMLRWVCHLDVSGKDVDMALQTVVQLLGEAS